MLLTQEEIHDMWGECSSPDDFAAMIERAVLANAGGQGPVCEVVQDNQDRYLSLACVGAVKPKVGDKLYAHPLPAQAIPEAYEINTLEHTKSKIYKQGWNDCRSAMLSASPKP